MLLYYCYSTSLFYYVVLFFLGSLLCHTLILLHSQEYLNFPHVPFVHYTIHAIFDIFYNIDYFLPQLNLSVSLTLLSSSVPIPVTKCSLSSVPDSLFPFFYDIHQLQREVHIEAMARMKHKNRTTERDETGETIIQEFLR